MTLNNKKMPKVKVWFAETHKSKKERICDRCGNKINIGDTYAYHKTSSFCKGCFTLKKIDDTGWYF